MTKETNLTLSDQIANCPKCMEHARWIDPINYGDLFQEAWLDIWKFEQRNPEKAKEVIHYQRYFYRALKFKHWSRVKAIKRHLNIDWVEENEIVEFEGDGICPEAYLKEWLDENPSDDLKFFYQNIITLAIVCKDNEDAIKTSNLGKTKYYEYLKQAKQKLKDDYTSIADSDNGSGDFIL